MALTKEQFLELRSKGLSTDQIIRFENGEKPSVSNTSETTQEAPKTSFLEKAGDFLGVTKLAKYEAAQVARLFSPEFNQAYKQDKTAMGVPSDKEVLGSAIMTGGNLAAPFLKTANAASAGGRILQSGLQSAAVGGTLGLGKGFESNGSASDIAKSTLLGAGTGFAVGSAAQGFGETLKKIIKPKNIYNRELQPPTKDMVADLERHGQTIGEKALNETDEAGKAVYRGGYDKMAKQAEGQISKNSKLLRSRLEQTPYVEHMLEDIASPVGGVPPEIADKIKAIELPKITSAEQFKQVIESKLTPEELANPAVRNAIRNNVDELSGIFKNEKTYLTPLKKIVKAQDFKKPLLEKLTDEFGALDDHQLATVEAELKKLPTKMSPIELLDNRQIVDSKIPKGFWIEPNPQRAFVGNVRYYLRGLMKNAIEDAAPTVPVRELNQKIGLAIDIKDLAYLQEALRMKGRGVGGIGFWKPISYVLDRTVFNPTVTTNVAQGINKFNPKLSALGTNFAVNQMGKK